MNNLSKNIRFLRKKNKLSQQQLADALSIKRSNIAAYETKGVEPRLVLINEMAVFFKVPLAALITTDLSAETAGESLQKLTVPGSHAALRDVAFELNGRRASLGDHAHRINQMLEGFKVFYEYKKNSAGVATNESDIDNFLVFVNHMHAYNEAITGILRKDQRTVAGSESKETNSSGASSTYPQGSR